MRVDPAADVRDPVRPATPEHAARDDRVLPQTRWLAAVIVPVLIVAFVLL